MFMIQGNCLVFSVLGLLKTFSTFLPTVHLTQFYYIVPNIDLEMVPRKAGSSCFVMGLCRAVGCSFTGNDVIVWAAVLIFYLLGLKKE